MDLIGRLVLVCVVCGVLSAGCAPDLMPAAGLSGPPPRYAGAYAGDLVWDGLVVMSGDVLILSGGSLTIRSGTQIRVVPAEGTQIDPEYLSAQTELLVRGRLDIQGTPGAPVRFVVPDQLDTDDYVWAGVTLDQAEPSRIAHAEISRADTAIRLVSCSPLIEGTLISRCRYGIIVQQQSHPKIFDNSIRDGEGGVYCWRDSRPTLRNNRISGHDEEGLFIDATSRPWLDRNILSGNGIGLALYPLDLPFAALSLHDNQEDVRWLGRQGLSGVSP